MKKCFLLLSLFTSTLMAQTGNHIHHLYGVSEPTSGLFKVSALNQQLDNDVEIETVSLNFSLGDEYFYNTINNNVFFLDSFSQPTFSSLYQYVLPEVYSSSFTAVQNNITFQTNFTNLCVDPLNDSIFYAYNSFDSTLYRMNYNLSVINSSPVINFATTPSNISLSYLNNFVYLSSKSDSNESVIYTLNGSDVSFISSNFYAYRSMYLAADFNSLYAIAQNDQFQNYLLRFLPATNQFDTIGLLPSCQNCAFETFLYDKNAIVVDSEKEEIIVSRTEIISGNEQYFISTFSLIDASIIYDIPTAERWSNLIFQQPMNDLVYPGDANHDKIVDITDIFPIGLRYNTLTTARNEISTAWIGQEAINVNDTLLNGVDFKHADCNGDGQINALDIDNAVLLNYSYFHNSEKSTNATCQFPMYVNLPNEMKEDEDVEVEIGLDLSNDLLKDVYGIAFTIEYDTNFVVENTFNTQGVDAWFGIENGNYLQRNRDDYSAGKMDVAVVGINQLNRNGGGVLLKGVWTMEDEVIPIAQDYDEMYFNIVDVVIIDFDENELDACGVDTTIRVYDKTVGIQERENLILDIYPNPTKANHINLSNVAEIDFVEIYNMQGQLMNVWKSDFDQININDFSKGIYIVKAFAEEKVYINKLVYAKQ